MCLLNSLDVKKRIVMVMVLCCYLAFNAHVGFAQPLKMVTFDAYPWGFLNEEGTPDGILTEIGNRILAEAGLSHENVLLPYVRAVKYVEIGEADLILVFSNETLEQKAVNVAPVFSLTTGIIGLAGIRYASLQDLHGKTVVYMRGGEYDEAFRNDSKITKDAVTDYEEEVKMLLNRRVDAAIGVLENFYMVARKLGYPQEQFGEPLVLNTRVVYLFLATKRANTDVIRTLKSAVETLKTQKTFETIIHKWIEGQN